MSRAAVYGAAVINVVMTADSGRAEILTTRIAITRVNTASAARSAVWGRVRVKNAARPVSSMEAADPASGTAKILTAARPTVSTAALRMAVRIISGEKMCVRSSMLAFTIAAGVVTKSAAKTRPMASTALTTCVVAMVNCLSAFSAMPAALRARRIGRSVNPRESSSGGTGVVQISRWSVMM